MSFQLKLDEQLEALQDLNHPLAPLFETILTSAGQAMADAIVAAVPNIIHGHTTMEGVAFAGICTPFWPTSRDVPLPEGWDMFDTPEEWRTQGDL